MSHTNLAAGIFFLFVTIGGHYYSIIKFMDKYMKCDDIKVTELKNEEMQKEMNSAYIVCYEKSRINWLSLSKIWVWI